MSNQVVVLGMHRSGTSMIAGALNSLGVFMGSKMLGKSRANPLGHFEDLEFLYLNEAILKSISCSWDRPPEKYNELNKVNVKLINKIKNLIKKRESRFDVWGWKDPRTSVLFPLYKPYLENPYLIICARDSEDIAKSLNKRNGFSIEKGKNITKSYWGKILDIINDTPYKRIILNYKTCICNPEETIEEIIKFLNVEPRKKDITDATRMILDRSTVKKLSEDFKGKNK